MTEDEDEEDEAPPGMKRAIVGLILPLLAWICGAAILFYLMYLVRMAFLHHHRHF